ncbi:MAG: Outer membrane protein assembly factor BamB [Phycisphaerae bacterium]|nr:Outer membrane protein assembly factor BamB [Phycisphaerae bacterium]
MRLSLMGLGLLICVSAACGDDAPPPGPADASAASAREVLAAAGRDGGLCVQMAGSPELAAALRNDGRCLVLLLETDGRTVAATRSKIASLTDYGPVSVRACEAANLPLADEMVNVVVIDDPARFARSGFTAAEVLRVLCPQGSAVVRADASGRQIADALKHAGAAVAESGAWLCARKPRPAGYDEWTHPNYGPGLSGVSRDKEIGPPEHLRWLTGPAFPSLGDYAYGPILSAGGRNYYMLSASQSLYPTFGAPPTTGDPGSRPLACELVARDAFNGLPLWRRACNAPYYTPIVADERRVYLRIGREVVAVDGRDGREVGRYPAVCTRLLLSDGRLVMDNGAALQAIDTRTGQQAWKAPLPSGGQFLIDSGRVVVLDAKGRQLTALNLVDGSEAWRQKDAPWIKPTDRLLFGRDGLVCVTSIGQGDRRVAGVASEDGKLLWEHSDQCPAGGKIGAVIYANGLVWIQSNIAPLAKEQPWTGLDPRTGAAKRTLAPRTSASGCYPQAATDRWLVLKGPSDFLSWEDGSISTFRAFRPTCRHGSTLANGMYYSAPNVCVCMVGVLHGFVGMSSRQSSAAGQSDVATSERLEAGPAIGGAGGGAADSPLDWPTFRHDAARSASASDKGFAARMKAAWKTPAASPTRCGPSLLADDVATNWTGADPVTAPTVAGGRVFVACPEQHRVAALDAAGGRLLWSATVGGRMDVPPTIFGGLCLVGCRDGSIFALRASDGELAWRYRLTPRDVQIAAFGQLESPWPVVGGVLVRDGWAYAIAGRTTSADGGVLVCCLDAAKGTPKWEVRSPLAGKNDFVGLADLLVADDKCISSGGNTHCRLDPATGALLGRAETDALRAGSQNGQYFGYVGSSSALLDRTWHFVGSGRVTGRFNTQWRAGLTGQLVAFDKDLAVACRVTFAKEGVGSLVTAQKPAPGGRPVQAPLWSIDLPAGQLAEALVLVGGHVLVGTASPDRKLGRLVVLAAKDGAKLAEYDLPAAIASEGIAVADGRVYVSTWSGEVVCFEPDAAGSH